MSTSPEKSGPRGHIPELDGVRGLAILLVLVHHCALLTLTGNDGGAAKLAFAGASSGWIGVDLFFVLSGFLITSILLKTKGKPHYFRNFIARRSLRIFPLYFLFLAAFFAWASFYSGSDKGVAEAVADQPWYWSYLYNVRMGATGWSKSPIAHFWSLAVEEQFYLFWPLVVYLCSRRALAGVCLSLVVTALLVRIACVSAGYHVAAYTLLPARVDSLALGSLCALLPTRLAAQRWFRYLPVYSGAALLALFVAKGGLYQEDPLVMTLGISLASLFFGSSIWSAVHLPRPWLSRCLTLPSIVWVGKFSYAIYILHGPVAILASQSLAPHLADLSGVLRLVTFTGVVSAITAILAVGSWNLVESPFLAMKKYFV
jgi:peptidoglycan/LPS O-acetylase OafA/YrhL